MDHVIVDPGPGLRYLLVANVVRHGRCFGREYRHVRAALSERAQLIVLDRLADFVVTNRREFSRRLSRIVEVRDLRVTIRLQLRRGRGVVAVAIDDHPCVSCLLDAALLLCARIRIRT